VGDLLGDPAELRALDVGVSPRRLVRVVRPGGVAAIVEHNPLNPLTRLVVARCANHLVRTACCGVAHSAKEF
jgi:hypothetical protein